MVPPEKQHSGEGHVPLLSQNIGQRVVKRGAFGFRDWKILYGKDPGDSVQRQSPPQTDQQAESESRHLQDRSQRLRNELFEIPAQPTEFADTAKTVAPTYQGQHFLVKVCGR
ncbi:hypothetical protein BV898_19368 [Hypsibius exemplaris]|uniref:Uncharacterized protein n=1 Tax=Hypsibius exemplaris TaxID=2072580 RepID=A0A9X6RPP7_HYPEX|nr:hypothetical protein BV898_19368 [Hypsibius exemplaris]